MFVINLNNSLAGYTTLKQKLKILRKIHSIRFKFVKVQIDVIYNIVVAITITKIVRTFNVGERVVAMAATMS